MRCGHPPDASPPLGTGDPPAPGLPCSGSNPCTGRGELKLQALFLPPLVVASGRASSSGCPSPNGRAAAGPRLHGENNFGKFPCGTGVVPQPAAASSQHLPRLWLTQILPQTSVPIQPPAAVPTGAVTVRWHRGTGPGHGCVRPLPRPSRVCGHRGCPMQGGGRSTRRPRHPATACTTQNLPPKPAQPVGSTLLPARCPHPPLPPPPPLPATATAGQEVTRFLGHHQPLLPRSLQGHRCHPTWLRI